MIISRQYLVALAVLAPTLVFADQHYAKVQAWLEKMHHATHMVNYDGTFVYGQNNQLSSMRIIHSVDKHGEKERLVSLDGSGREVIRDNQTVKCILPDSKTVVVEKSRPQTQFPPTFPMRIDNLVEQYVFSLGAKERVAGQLAQKITISPKDKLRYGHQLWVDNKTGLLLKSYLIDEHGQPVEQFMFTHITFLDKVPASLLEPTISGKEFTWYEAEEDPANNGKREINNWQVTHLPTGFRQDMQRVHNVSHSKMPVNHLVFSDGLTSISVFIQADDASEKNLIGSTRMGAVNAHGSVVSGHHITVVGEVPHAAVKMIGESIRLRAR